MQIDNSTHVHVHDMFLFLMYIRGYMTVSPYLWSPLLPLVVRVDVQYVGGHTDWLHPEEWLNTDEN